MTREKHKHQARKREEKRGGSKETRQKKKKKHKSPEEESGEWRPRGHMHGLNEEKEREQG